MTMCNRFALWIRIAPLIALCGQLEMAYAGELDASLKSRVAIGICLLWLTYVAILAATLSHQSRRSAAALAEAAARDISWETGTLHGRVRAVFETVQAAWMERDPEGARQYMSEALYRQHQTRIEQMLRHHERNVMKETVIWQLRVVAISDYANDARDCFWAFVGGTMIDCLVDDRNGDPIRGSLTSPVTFQQLWKFVRAPQGWVVDHIDRHAGVLSLVDWGAARPATPQPHPPSTLRDHGPI
jgi:hypothetical protein